MSRLVAPSEKSLAEILYQQQQLAEAIPVPLTLAILRQVCDALEWAHNLTDPNGQPLYILHRDVSPANIYVGLTGAVRLVASTAAQANCGYVAPEVLVGMNADPRADLFSLGVVAHEMLTNQRLFLGVNDHDTLSRVCAFPIPLPSTINPMVTADVEGIVLMALARDPTYRWQSAGMMRDGFASVAQRHGFELGPEGANLWYGLYMGYPAPRPEPVLPNVMFSSPAEQVIAPPVGAPPMEAPPSGEWSDDTNNETQIQQSVDPRLQAAKPSEPAAKTPRPEPAQRTPRPELRTKEPSQRTPRPDLSVADLPSPRMPDLPEPPPRKAEDLPAPRAKQPTGQTANPASNALFEDLPAPRTKQPTAAPPSNALFEDLPAPRVKQPTGQGIKPASSSLFEDLPSPKAKGVADLPAPKGGFADLPAPRAPEPNQRGVALEDLPPDPRPEPQPRPQPAHAPNPFEGMDLPGGKNQHARASTADVDAFLSSVDDPDLDQVSHVPASPQRPGPGAPQSAKGAFELELGEFTQIGAAPLISFGNTGETPIALVGVGPRAPPPRTSAPTLPPPFTVVVGNRDDDDDEAARKKKLLMIVAGVVLVLVAAVVAFVLFSD